MTRHSSLSNFASNKLNLNPLLNWPSYLRRTIAQVCLSSDNMPGDEFMNSPQHFPLLLIKEQRHVLEKNFSGCRHKESFHKEISTRSVL